MQDAADALHRPGALEQAVQVAAYQALCDAELSAMHARPVTAGTP